MSHKDQITIVVTDSGLGGISTTADLCCRFKNQGSNKKVKIIYFNSLADNSLGYNDMKSTVQKIHVFNNALESMYQNYQPDYILIACNTLSVIHEQTAFSRRGLIPVIGIVDAAVKMMMTYLTANAVSSVIILGTQTTISSGLYPKMLIQRGIAPDRMIAEACSTLHIEIENDAGSLKVKDLIRFHVNNAFSNLPQHSESVGVSLNCTHYAYASSIFEGFFCQSNIKNISLINPNTHMSDFLFAKEPKVMNPEISIEVISQAELTQKSIASTAGLIQDSAPELVLALRNYNRNPKLFEWKNV